MSSSVHYIGTLCASCRRTTLSGREATMVLNTNLTKVSYMTLWQRSADRFVVASMGGAEGRGAKSGLTEKHRVDTAAVQCLAGSDSSTGHWTASLGQD